MAAVGERPWSGRLWRLFTLTAPTHALCGGSIFLGYRLIMEYLRHHGETNLRPMFIDHQIACTIIGSLAGAIAFHNSTRGFIVGAMFSFV